MSTGFQKCITPFSRFDIYDSTLQQPNDIYKKWYSFFELIAFFLEILVWLQKCCKLSCCVFVLYKKEKLYFDSNDEKKEENRDIVSDSMYSPQQFIGA